jgi:phasin
METDMTNETNTVINGVKEAFAPVTDALKNIQKLDVPEAARDFVKRAASNAKDRAADVYEGSEKITNAIEAAVTNSVSENAKITRAIQQAIHQDTEAFYNGIEKLAAAKSFEEAFQIQSDLVRARGEVFVTRAKAVGEYVAKLVTNGAKDVQENFSKVAASYNKAA